MDKHFQFKRSYRGLILFAIIMIGFSLYRAIDMATPEDHSRDYIPLQGTDISSSNGRSPISDSAAKAEQIRWKKFTLRHAKKNKLENMIEEKVQEYGPQ